MEDPREPSAGPVRVAELTLDNRRQSEALLGAGVNVDRCRVAFRNMLPAAEEARLLAVLPHGISITFGDEGDGLLVPWGNISYVTFSS